MRGGYHGIKKNDTHAKNSAGYGQPKTHVVTGKNDRQEKKVQKGNTIGDKISDMQAIHRVGGKGVLIGKCTDKVKSDYDAKDILDAVKWILGDINHEDSR